MGKLGTDKRPVTGAVIPPLTAREREHRNHVTDGAPNIARHGTTPKRALDIVPVHPGMHTSTRHADVKHLYGITETTFRAPDASSPDPQDPTIPGKVSAHPAPVVGHRSRTMGQETDVRLPGVHHARGRDNARLAELGRIVLDEAKQTGSR